MPPMMPNPGFGQQTQQYGPQSAMPYQQPMNQPSLSSLSGPNTPQPMVPGRMVASEDEIKPNEVPMDLSVALFLKSDLSCVYAKQWNRNGTIDSVKYIPEPKPAMATASIDEGFEKRLMDRLDQIERQLNKKPHYNKPKPKKEEPST